MKKSVSISSLITESLIFRPFLNVSVRLLPPVPSKFYITQAPSFLSFLKLPLKNNQPSNTDA